MKVDYVVYTIFIIHFWGCHSFINY